MFKLLVLVLYFHIDIAPAAVRVVVKNGTLECMPCFCIRTSAGKIHADCSKRNITEVPAHLPETITVLDISKNGICLFNRSLNRYKHLSFLVASHNELNHFRRDDFAELFKLVHLDLSNNKIALRKNNYPAGLFRHQTNLVTLFLQNNSDCTDNSDLQYPDEAFSHLKSLQTLHIDGLADCSFGEGFIHLQKLESLYLDGKCNIGTLRNDSFKHLPNIKFLDISRCEIIDVELSAFAPLSDIMERLDVSHNPDLGIINFGHAMYGLQNKTVKLLKANKLHRERGTGLLIRSDDFKYMQNVVVEELHVDENRIELLDMSVTALFHSVKQISAKKNMLLFGPFVFTGMALTELQWADISGQGTSTAELVNLHVDTNDDSFKRKVRSSKPELDQSSHFHQKLSRKKTLESIPEIINLPPKIQFANFSRSKYSFNIDNFKFGENELRLLDLSHNFFTHWNGPISGLEKLEHVDLSNNFCDSVSEKFLIGFPSLKFLKLSKNYLGFTLETMNTSLLTHLEHLDLADNKITKLPPHFFTSFDSIQYLDLSSNTLSSWDVTVENMLNLTYLDLSNNMFESLPLNLETQLEGISNGKLKVNLENNPLKCDCSTTASLKWLDNKGRKLVDLRYLTCSFYRENNKLNMTYLHDIVLELEKHCASYIGLMMGILCVVLLFLALAVSGLTYRYRWKLRYLYYLTMNRHRGYLQVQDEEQNFDFDAFISYADEDRGFVVKDMRKILEEPEEEEETFRLCIHHRDFMPGEAIAANIQKAINTSRKTVVILTRNFLKSYWCRYEVEMAKMESIYRGRNTLLIVVLEDIPVMDLPADIMEVMRKDSYIEFTKDREGQEVFWQNLKRAIRN